METFTWLYHRAACGLAIDSRRGTQEMLLHPKDLTKAIFLRVVRLASRMGVMRYFEVVSVRTKSLLGFLPGMSFLIQSIVRGGRNLFFP
jgi:hypothetical protein